MYCDNRRRARRNKLTKGYGKERVEIKRFECNDAHRIIGTRIDPSGGQIIEHNFRKGQTQDIATEISGSHLGRQLAARAHKNAYLPRSIHPLSATALTKTQLTEIYPMAEVAYLTRVGLDRKSPKTVLRKAPQYGGYGDPGPYTSKGY